MKTDYIIEINYIIKDINTGEFFQSFYNGGETFKFNKDAFYAETTTSKSTALKMVNQLLHIDELLVLEVIETYSKK